MFAYSYKCIRVFDSVMFGQTIIISIVPVHPVKLHAEK